jgi:phosphoribosylformylglycinamidine (FGAM) synthase PurS component
MNNENINSKINSYIKKVENYKFNNKNINNNDLKKHFKKPIGLFDPLGENINPLTGNPYENLYSSDVIEYKSGPLEGVTVPKTYKNLAYLWTNYGVYNNMLPILDSIKKNQVTLVKAGTGTGKTVITPKIALQAFNFQKKVICAVPKQVLTESSAEFASECLDVNVGDQVGYFYMGRNKTSATSKLIFTTPGSLKSVITRNEDDPYLSEYDCVILDEIHERSVQTDQLLLMMKTILEKRPEFRLILMSATMNLELFNKYYTSSKITCGEIIVEGISFNVDIFYEKKQVKDIRGETINKIVHILKTTQSGDILVFVKTGGDGKMLCQGLEQATKSLNGINPYCVKLEAKSTPEEKKYARNEFAYKSHPDSDPSHPYTRKVVMATNVIESGITVDGIIYVIDNGSSMEASFFPKQNARSLVDSRISKAAAAQRKGRAGRTTNGFCYRMYTEEEFNKFHEYPVPDIQKTDITSDMLDIYLLDYVKNNGDMRKFLNNLISPPSEDFIISSLNKLYGLGAISSLDNNGVITPLGQAISKFRAIEVNFAKSILASYEYFCKDDVINIIVIAMKLDSRIDNLFDIQINKKSTEHEQKKEVERVKQMHKKLFYSPYGDYITILNVYNALKTYMRKSSYNKNSNSINTINNSMNEKKDPKKWCREHGISSRTFINRDYPKKSGWDFIGDSARKLKYILTSIMKPEKNKALIEIEPGENFLEQDIVLPKNNLINISGGKSNVKINKNLEQINNTQSVNITKNNKKYFPGAQAFIDSLQENIYSSYELKNIYYKERKRIPLTDNEKKLIKKPNEEFNNMKVLMALSLGNITNFAKLVNKKDGKYKTCFPIEKVYAKTDRNSTLIKKPDLIMYNELFTTSKDNKVLKLNLSTEVPKIIVNQLKNEYGSIIKSCFEKEIVIPQIKLRKIKSHKSKSHKSKRHKKK